MLFLKISSRQLKDINQCRMKSPMDASSMKGALKRKISAPEVYLSLIRSMEDS
jgi:hypothetical protein